MQAVAVGGFHHHIVGSRHRLGIPDNGLVEVPDIPGKDDGAGLVFLGHGKADRRRPQQMAGVVPVGGHTGEQLGMVAVAYRHQQLQRRRGVFHGIQRLFAGVAAALVLFRLPLRVAFLDAGTVHQHDLQQITGRPGGVDWPGKAVFHQQRQPSAVVGVGVGHAYRVNGGRVKGQGVLAVNVSALLQAAVDEDVLTAGRQTMATARHHPRRAPKADFHREWSPFR